MSASPAALRLALACAPLTLLAACPVDEDRGLSFGFGVTSGSSSSLSRGGDHGGNSSEEGGTDSVDAAGNGPSTAGSTTDGGDATGGGAPNGSGGNSEGGAPPGGGAIGGGTTGGSSNVGGSGGASAGGGDVAGNGGSSGSAGSAGMPDTGPCGDIDGNGVQDCDETLAHNSRFATNDQAWLADFGVTQVWRTEDARGTAGSGSVAVTFTTTSASSGWALAATGQCLPAWGEWSYEVGARAFVPEGQTGQAEISLAAFGNDECLGSYLGTVTPATSAKAGSWQALRGSVKMPAGTRSILLRLAAAKPGSQASFEVRFDDVLFRKK